MGMQEQVRIAEKFSAKCACRIDGLEEEQLRGGLDLPEILYCPMHQAAPALLAACQYAYDVLMFKGLANEAYNRPEAVKQLQAALAAAEGRAG